MAASLNPRIGQLGKDRNPTRWFRREGMERVVSAIFCLSFGIDLDGEAGTRHRVRSSCRAKASKYVLLFNLYLFFPIREHAANHGASTFN